VLFWALDRFTREGMVPTIMHLQRLAACGVGFHSYTEAHLATDNELVRNILLALLASLAKVEAQKISERTKAASQGSRQTDRPPRHLSQATGQDRRAHRCRCFALPCRQGPRHRPTYGRQIRKPACLKGEN
jgi:DNA invertase Pin-like site-specific DNA recombinase